MLDAVAVLQQIIGGEDIFRIVVRNAFKRCIFSVLRAFAFADRIGDLHIAIVELIIPQNEITLQFAYPADAHRIVKAFGIYIHHVLQCGTVIDAVVGVGRKIEGDVRKVVLLLPAESALGFHIKAVTLIKDLALEQHLDISRQCRMFYLYPVFCQSLLQALDADGSPEIVDDEIAHIVESLDIAHLHTPFDVFFKDLVDDGAHISALVGKVVILHRLGETAFLQVIVQLYEQIGIHFFAEKRLHIEVLVKAQREKLELHISARELGDKLSAQKIGIGACYEHGILACAAVSIDDFFKVFNILDLVYKQILRPLGVSQ